MPAGRSCFHRVSVDVNQLIHRMRITPLYRFVAIEKPMIIVRCLSLDYYHWPGSSEAIWPNAQKNKHRNYFDSVQLSYKCSLLLTFEYIAKYRVSARQFWVEDKQMKYELLAIASNVRKKAINRSNKKSTAVNANRWKKGELGRRT